MNRNLSAFLNISVLAALVALAACGTSKEAELENLDNQIAGNETDPALTSALADQILVDPNLTQQSNRNAARPAESPTQAPYPAPAPGVREASVESSGPDKAACGGKFNYDKVWATRLPAPFAVYPGGRISDAAGEDRGRCRARVVTFTSATAPKAMLGWYRAAATRGGYSADYQARGSDHVLAGVDETGGAYYLIVTPLPSGGSDVALIAKRQG